MSLTRGWGYTFNRPPTPNVTNLPLGLAPGATVSVFFTGTQTPVTLYAKADRSQGLANPFVSDVNAYFDFYANTTNVDVRISGTGITAPYTLGDFLPVTYESFDIRSFGAKCDGVTDDTAAWVAADAVCATLSGGTILFSGISIVNDFTPTASNLCIQGQGRETSKLKGSTAGSFVLRFNDISRGRLADCSVDGGGVKTNAFRISGLNGAGSWSVRETLFYGGTVDVVVVGGYAGEGTDPDVSSNYFFNVAIQGGAFGSPNPSNSQLILSGSNTVPFAMYGGVIAGGQIPVNVRVSGGLSSFYDVQFANSTQDNFELAGGSVCLHGGHSEGTGRFLHTLSNDPQTLKSAVSTFTGVQMVNVNGSGDTILHESNRRILLAGCFSEGNITFGIGDCQVLDQGTIFASTSHFVQQANGNQLLGIDDVGNMLLPYGGLLKSVNLSQSLSTLLAAGFFTALSAADVEGPNAGSGLYLVSDTISGGSAVVLFSSGQTPVIVAQINSVSLGAPVFVTGGPTAAQIQLKASGATTRLAMRAGATRNNDVVSITALGLI